MNESDPEESDVQTVFICKRCPGETFDEDQREAHRNFHRNQRASKGPSTPGPASKTRGRPGPASRTRRAATDQRSTSPAPSSLFSVQQQQRKSTRVKPVKIPEDTSAEVRKHRAFRKHIEGSKVYNMKNTGG